MNYIRVGLGISMFFACYSCVRAFVLTETGSKGVHHHSNDIENRLLFLAKFLERISSITDADVSSTDGAAKSEQENEQGFNDFEDMLRILDASEKQDINLEKKDYAILPPASEWCRMMGLRRCRGSSS